MALPVTDAFTNTDETAIATHDSGYTVEQGSAKIYSNKAVGSFDSWTHTVIRRNDETFDDDQYSEGVVSLTAADNSVSGTICARIQSGTPYCYYFLIPANSANNMLLVRRDGGGQTTLSSVARTGFSSGDTARIECEGTTITALINGSTTGAPASSTDSTHTGGDAGFGWQQNHNTAVALDDWEAGDIGGGGGTTVECTTDALVLAEGTADIVAATVVATTTDALVLTEGQADIEAAVVVNTATHALVLSEGQATVEAATVVNCNTHALTLTEGVANIVTAGGAIETTTHALVLAEGVASVEAATVVNCTTHALTLSANVAGIITTAPSAEYSVVVENQMIAELSDTLFPIDVAVDSTGGVTGLSITAALRDPDDNTSYLDWSDLTFKTSGWTTKFQSLTEYGNGFYGTNLDVSSITNFPSANHAAVEYDISGTVVAVSQGLLSISQTWFQAQALTVGKFLGLK